MANILMVVAPTEFRDEELFDTKQELESAGHRVTVASTHVGPCTGMRGGVAEATTRIDEVAADAYAAVIFVGGGGARVLFDDPAAHAIARSLCANGRIVGAICVAPTILARAGLTEGRRVSVFPSQTETLRASGARVQDHPVTVDGNVITASGPVAARSFGKAIAQALSTL